MSFKKTTIIACYSLDGKLVKTYKSAAQASRSRHVHPRTIDKCTRGDVLTVKGYIWKRVDSSNIPETIPPLEKKVEAPRFKPVAKLDDEGKIIKTYPSINQACKDNKIDPHSLRDLIGGKYKYDGKARYRYLSDIEIKEYGYQKGDVFTITPKAVIQYDLDGNYLHSYPSIREASKSINKSVQGIQQCLSGKYQTAYGYKWKYKDLDNPKKEKEKKIYQYDKSSHLINIYKSVKSASDKTGISVTSINNCLRGEQSSTKGYIFKRK